MAAAIGNYARKTASASKPAQLSMRPCDVNMRVLEATKPVHGAIDDESHVENKAWSKSRLASHLIRITVCQDADAYWTDH